MLYCCHFRDKSEGGWLVSSLVRCESVIEQDDRRLYSAVSELKSVVRNVCENVYSPSLHVSMTFLLYTSLLATKFSLDRSRPRSPRIAPLRIALP